MVIILAIIFLILAIGIFGFTIKALIMWFLGINIFYIGWLIIDRIKNRGK